MKPRCVRTALLFLLLVAAPAAAAETSLADLLPPGTPVFFEMRNPTPAEYDRMAISDCLDEPGLRALLERLSSGEDSITSMRLPLGQAAISMSTDLGEMKVRLRYVDAEGERSFVMRDRMSLGVVGLQQAPVPVDLVAGIEIEGDTGSAAETIEKVLLAIGYRIGQQLGQAAPEHAELFEASSATFDVGGVTARTVSFGDVALHLAPADPWVVLTTSRARLEDVLARHADGEEPSLAADPDYREVLESARGDGTATATMVVRLDRALEIVREAYPQAAGMVGAQLRMVGLQGLRSFSTVARVEGSGVASTTTLRIDGARRGLGRFFRPSEPASFGPLRFAPKETLYVVAGRFTPSTAWDALMEVGGMATAGAQVSFEERFGLKLRGGLLDLVGPEAALIVATNRGLVPDVGIVLESRDAPRLVAALRRMLEQVDWVPGTGVRSVDMGGTTAYVAALGHPRLANFPIAPTFGAVDGHVIVAPYPLSFQRLLATGNGEREGLDGNADYAALKERLPEGIGSMSYLDLPRVVAILYETAIPFMQSMPSPQRMDSVYAIPDASHLVRHLYGRIAWSEADETGMRWYSHSSFDSTGFFLGMLGGGVGVLTMMGRSEDPRPVERALVVKGRERPPAVDASVCLDRARTLRARLKLYAATHDGSLPPDIAALRAPHVDPATFVCPGPDRSYVYLGPKGEGRVLLHGHPNGPEGGVTVIDLDLEVRRVSPDELSAMRRPAAAPADR